MLRSGQLSLGPRVPAFERAFAARLGAPPRERGLLRHRRRCTSRCGRSAWRRATRSSRRRSRSSPRANAILYERATAGVRRHRPASRSTSTRTRPRRRSRAARRRCCRCTSSATRPTCRRSSATACRSSRTPARRSARSTPTASPVGGRGHPAAFGFYANKQLTTGEGGMLTMGSAEHKERVDSERNQGRAPDMGWLDHDRLGFNYRLTDIACALGLAQLERLDGMLADRARVAGWYREALAGLERARRCRARTPAATCAAGSCSSSSCPRGVDRDDDDRRAARARRAVQALPARDPPDVLLPRALRPPRGRVPGLRGRRGALASRCRSSRR